MYSLQNYRGKCSGICRFWSALFNLRWASVYLYDFYGLRIWKYSVQLKLGSESACMGMVDTDSRKRMFVFFCIFLIFTL